MSPARFLMRAHIVPVVLIVLAVFGALTWADEARGTVTNKLPQVNFGADPRRGDVPLTVRFTNTTTDADGTLIRFLWNFGDGTTSTEENPTHKYETPGKFDVTLSVTDDAGGTDSKLTKEFVTVDPPSLTAAMLPVSRSVLVGTPATAFVTVINLGAITASAVGIELNPSTGPGGTRLPATLTFQTTDFSTNQLTGAPNLPVDIPAGGTQSYLITVTPTAPFAPTDVRVDISGVNTRSARSVPGLNTLLLSASTEPTSDIPAVASTIDGNGIVSIPGTTGTGVFAVATANVGASGTITASADAVPPGLPVRLLLCQTESATGQCVTPIGSSVTTTMDAGATFAFAVFVTGTGTVPFDPELNRLFVRFSDAGGQIRGATSVAVKTQ